ncbi:hypothetical protein [Brachybacterium squillarum]|uniref:hypothetical protein n=1 Tax=Brachybacterium squillarum TaxID=661979 RepID=UPI000262A002|nr:hypothetical protein [Brachybacterium squillarum]
MRTLIAQLTVLASSTLLLTACGGGATEDPSSTAEESQSSSTATATAIETLWVDDSWTIEDLAEDLCAEGGPHPTPYSPQEDMFICGPTIAASQACAIEEGTEVVCIVDAFGKRAIRFDSPTAAESTWGALTEDAVPVVVTLEDGVRCDTLMDEADHRMNPTTSWYRCEDGSELATDTDIENTFTRGETWTVQRSFPDQEEYVGTPLSAVTFAGR